MRLERLQVKNFRNLRQIDVPLAPGAVIVGENRAGKSNLLFAVRLVLDPSLPNSERVLDRADFSDSLSDGTRAWDPMRSEETIEISVDLADIEEEPAILAALGDALIEGDPVRARLTYRFFPRDDAENVDEEEQGTGAPEYDWTIVGGAEENEVRWDVRRFLAHVHLPALRDAQGDLASWRRSPLKPLLIAAAEAIDPEDLSETSEAVEEANRRVGALEEVRNLAERISARTIDLVGERQGLDTRLDVAPVDPMRLIRSLRLLVDGDAQRSLSAASPGALNVLYLALLELGLDAQLANEKIAHVVLTIEEPEAHLHPHVQRALFNSLLRGEHTTGRTVLVSTHSPHIVSVAEPQDLIVLKDGANGTSAHAAAVADLTDVEWRDLRRYLDATRSEMVFAARVLLVEGYAELVLAPRFAAALDIDLDQLGITVCAVHGTHFGTYARFLSALEIPWAAVTDGDPEVPQTGEARAEALLERLDRAGDDAEDVGIYVGRTTLERDIYDRSVRNRIRCLGALRRELIPQVDLDTVNQAYADERAAYEQYRADRAAAGEDGEVPAPEAIMSSEQFLTIVAKAGKGSFAQRLAADSSPPRPPRHFRRALERLAE